MHMTKKEILKKTRNGKYRNTNTFTVEHFQVLCTFGTNYIGKRELSTLILVQLEPKYQ